MIARLPRPAGDLRYFRPRKAGGSRGRSPPRHGRQGDCSHSDRDRQALPLPGSHPPLRQWPDSKISVGLTPASLPKHGSSLDLAIAVAILTANERVPALPPGQSAMFYAELVAKAHPRREPSTAFRLATMVSDSIRSPSSVQLRQNHPPVGNAASSARIADAASSSGTGFSSHCGIS